MSAAGSCARICPSCSADLPRRISATSISCLPAAATTSAPVLPRWPIRLASAIASRLLGWVNDAELPLLYAEVLCLAYLSEYEGFGLQICEAMAVGCPVLASRATSLPEVVGDGGETFRLDDPLRASPRCSAVLPATPRSATISRSRARTRSLLFLLATHRRSHRRRLSRTGRTGAPSPPPGGSPLCAFDVLAASNFGTTSRCSCWSRRPSACRLRDGCANGWVTRFSAASTSSTPRPGG